jgi:four helix bundle protein
MEISAINFNDKFRQRSKSLAISICRWADGLPKKDSLHYLKGQIIRSSTSVAANFSAACRARSPKEHYSKICIVVEECDETLFWIDFITELYSLENENIIKLKQETSELLAVFSSTRKSLKEKYNS